MFTDETVQMEDGTSVALHSAVVKSKSLKRKVKVVVAELKCGDRFIRKIFFSTDLSLDASEIFLVYHSRFQIEFLYRDAKQNMGLEDWQSTDKDRLSFWYNASLSAVNVAREVADTIQEETGCKLSVASVKKVLHNIVLYQHIKEFIEGQKSCDSKNNNGLPEGLPDNLLFFGVRDSA